MVESDDEPTAKKICRRYSQECFAVKHVIKTNC